MIKCSEPVPCPPQLPAKTEGAVDRSEDWYTNAPLNGKSCLRCFLREERVGRIGDGRQAEQGNPEGQAPQGEQGKVPAPKPKERSYYQALRRSVVLEAESEISLN